MAASGNLAIAKDARWCGGASSSRLSTGHGIALMVLVLMNACGLQPSLFQRQIGDIGRIDFRPPNYGSEGIVIGATQGFSGPTALEYATAVSEKTGAALVVAYGFRTKRIPVAQPLVHNAPLLVLARDFNQPGSVYPEFKELLENTVAGPLRFYIGFRIADRMSRLSRIEVASSGLTFEQLQALKAEYFRIRNLAIDGTDAPRLDLALNPLDDVTWNITGVKNHGVLMLAEQGLILRLPKLLTEDRAKAVYQTVLIEWLTGALRKTAPEYESLPAMHVESLERGRIDSLPSRNNIAGLVIAAPHGSFDPHTGDLVQELSQRTGFAAVMTKGFTPTEYGGSRINVNRPTEKRYPRDAIEAERATERAKEIYERFKKTVLRAARGPLNVYFDFHENGSERHFDVATFGVSDLEARAIKASYGEIRDRRLKNFGSLPKVDLLIEPIDKVTFQALVAKERGILRLAKRSIHIELPARRIFNDTGVRRAYTDILADLITQVAAIFTTPIASAARIDAARQ